MTKTQARKSVKELMTEASRLEISPIINLYEIDLTDIAFDAGITDDVPLVFRFHNNLKLFRRSIFWQGKEFFAIPIDVSGLEFSAKGTLPTPKISLAVGEEGLPLLSLFKEQIYNLRDLSGAKVVFISTFAKYLDEQNFFNIEKPKDFSPDPNNEFPREIYYIDRKSFESKYALEYELISKLDARSKKLPGRIVVANRCPFLYRGEGCCYEYASRRDDTLHKGATLPIIAPAVANDRDENIASVLDVPAIIDRGEYKTGQVALKGDQFFIERGGRKYYFVCSVDNPTAPPPNTNYWIQDSCSKLVNGCELRYGVDGSAFGNITRGILRYGGFPAVNKVE